MKLYIKHLKEAVSVTFIISLCFFLFATQHAWRKSNRFITAEISDVLKSSIQESTNTKMIDQDFSYHRKSSDRKIGEYETRTFTLADTVISYRTQIADHQTEIFRGNLNYLLLTDQLHPKPIHLLFDSLLQTKGIYNTQTVVGITASFYKKMNEWSGDSTAISIDHRASLTKQGEFEDINCYAYMDCSFLTYWKLMNKTGLFILFLLMLISGSLLVVFKIREIRQLKQEIILLPDGSYRLKQTIIYPESRKAITPAGEFELSLQQAQLLSLFLQSESQKVTKEAIIEKFWKKNIDPSNNITTAIKRLKDLLTKIECPYTIVFVNSPEEQTDYYQLVFSKEPDAKEKPSKENRTMG